MDKIILIVHIPVGKRNAHDTYTFLRDAKIYIDSICDDGSVIHYVFPSSVDGDDIRVECVNPKLIEADQYSKIKERLDSSLEMIDSYIKELYKK